ncbi:MAG: DUF2442 domain-containing protein [Bacteroidia bacterium]
MIYIQDISLLQDFISLQIDGKQFKISLEKASAKLKSATEIERNLYKISPSGYGIHWPLLDEDLSVDALLKIAE